MSSEQPSTTAAGTNHQDLQLTAPVPFTAKCLGWLFASILKLFFITWRKSCTGFERIDEYRDNQAKMILCFWHGKYVPIFALCAWQWVQQRGETAVAFTSWSPRGIVIGEICRQFGLSCVQLPDNGRKHSFRLMQEAMQRHSTGVIAVDGPLGPKGVVKQGAIRIASELGYLLVPASVWSSHKSVMHKRWDDMEIPWPCCHTALAVGEPVQIPESVAKADIRTIMQHLAEQINQLEDNARQLVAKHGID
ncbi:MAG: hypothetical protein K0U68_15660 [Gammaproteobacteria bacterium]|nr:hypothetical protein [Gammaproteobacteria bacterium]